MVLFSIGVLEPDLWMPHLLGIAWCNCIQIQVAKYLSCRWHLQVCSPLLFLRAARNLFEFRVDVGLLEWGIPWYTLVDKSPGSDFNYKTAAAFCRAQVYFPGAYQLIFEPLPNTGLKP